MSWPAIREYLLARLQEPSTWRGLVLCATAAGIGIEPDAAEAITALGMLGAGLIGVMTEDRK